MDISETLYAVDIKDVNFNNMPNNEEYYFTIDLVGGKRVHRCGYIKSMPSHIKYVLLSEEQLS